MEHPPLPQASLPGPPPPPPPTSAHVTEIIAIAPPPPPPPDQPPQQKPVHVTSKLAGNQRRSLQNEREVLSKSKPQKKLHPAGTPPERRMLENNLTRDTPFVANIKFRNALPELPCDPKILARQHDPETLSCFLMTSAEESLRPDLAQPSDPSVASPMHSHKHWYRDTPGELHPDDRALIEGQVGGARAQRGNVAWLMKTRYLHATNSAPASHKVAAKPEACPAVTLAEAKQQIEASFKAAKETPVHPTRAGIQPVQVMPLLPFFERYGHTHVTASSTSEVVTHVSSQGTSERERQAMYGECMMRTYPIPDGQPGRKYLALLLPSSTTSEHAPEDKVHGEGRYRWAREFALDTQEFGDSSKCYVLALSGQGARYVPIESNMLISKRKLDELAHIEPPEHVDVQHRELSVEEQAQHKQRIGALYGFDMHDEQDAAGAKILETG